MNTKDCPEAVIHEHFRELLDRVKSREKPSLSTATKRGQASVAFLAAMRFRGNHPACMATPDPRLLQSRLVVLFRPNLPEIDTRLSVQGLCRSRRGAFSDDTVNGTAAIADYKPVLDYSVRGAPGGRKAHSS
jgi:hypothetical protein